VATSKQYDLLWKKFHESIDALRKALHKDGNRLDVKWTIRAQKGTVLMAPAPRSDFKFDRNQWKTPRD